MKEIELKSGKKWPVNTAYCGDNMDFLSQLPDNCLDSVVTDGPYGLKFMGKKWDYDVPSVEFWKECLRVLKPGGHVLSFSSTRTYHRMAVNVEDAGFEIRDMISWVYGSGFPKSLNISKKIDKHGGNSVSWFGEWFRSWRRKQGISSNEVAKLFPSSTGNITGCVRNWELGLNIPTAEQYSKIVKHYNLPFKTISEAERSVVGKLKTNITVMKDIGGNSISGEIDITSSSTDEAKQWDGWGSALKPAVESIVLARKPLSEKTLAQNVLKWGTGGINIDGCRVEYSKNNPPIPQLSQGKTEVNSKKTMYDGHSFNKSETKATIGGNLSGRFPANFIHDGSEEVIRNFPETKSGEANFRKESGKENNGNTSSSYGAESRAVGSEMVSYGDQGSASRFFYVAKPSPEERGKENRHPTVKPIALMRYLIRMVTPPGGITGDFFLGSFTSAIAAYKESINWIGAERPEKDHGSFDMGNKRYQDKTQQILMDFS